MEAKKQGRLKAFYANVAKQQQLKAFYAAMAKKQQLADYYAAVEHNQQAAAQQATATAKAQQQQASQPCPTNQGPIYGNSCQHSANGPDDPGYVAQCPVPGEPKYVWPAAVDGQC